VFVNKFANIISIVFFQLTSSRRDYALETQLIYFIQIDSNLLKKYKFE